MTDDRRLITPQPLPKGSVPRPLSCQGPGNHASEGYRCANAGIEGCSGYVCRFCAAKSQPNKPYTEECNVCQLAVKNGCSMTKALAIIAELSPQAVKRGKATCASFDKNAPPCRNCIRHECRWCETKFRSHTNGSYCPDGPCGDLARREQDRRRKERLRQETLAAA
jgi:hypothetical protein